ncbi:hypothetical protein M5K25_025430 [Dendrobium thyrsiflorum]|uniref:Serine-threonine/tyrosine-protein kinase catalytic domain-containing protein n=1 Tax=Dendrobium thyrsiflorum TaxID=117978 RepID=A0ABD0U499_DENTH
MRNFSHLSCLSCVNGNGLNERRKTKAKRRSRFLVQGSLPSHNGFNDENLFGNRGFSGFYEGQLPKSKLEMALKRISPDSRQGMKEFVAKIASISRLRHRNLVQLLGYCRRRGELLLSSETSEQAMSSSTLSSTESSETLGSHGCMFEGGVRMSRLRCCRAQCEIEFDAGSRAESGQSRRT